MVLFKIHQRFKGHFLNELRVSFKVILCPSAYETLSGLALTDQNYLEAVELLKQRYGNPQFLRNTYMEQFMKLNIIE